MKHHLTEQELIEYQFELGSEVRMRKIAGHLGGCAQCHEHLEQLKRKFAALDLLREEVVVSEDLISQVVEQTGQPIRPKIIPFRPSAWIGAAAAVLLVALLLLAPHLGKEEVPGSEVVKKPKPTGPVEKMKLKKEEDVRRTAELGQTVAMKVETRPRAAIESLGSNTDKITEGVIVEQPPFAPASAIELVTLPRRDKVQLTIYNSADLTLVRERRNLTLKKGWNWLQFMWANTLIDPTSLSLEPLERADKIDIQQLVFPARLRELGRWLIRSEVSGQVPFEITYFTSGLRWRAFYMGTLTEDEESMQLQGYVRIGNKSGEDYEKAQTRLIVGKVHILDQIAELAKRQYPYGSPLRIGGLGYGETGGGIVLNGGGKVPLLGEMPLVGRLFKGEKYKPKEIKKEGLSEYFLYTIEGTETIADKWGKRLLSFKAEDIEVESLYKYDEEQWRGQTIRFVKFANDEEHNLGETPIPNGTVKIYSQADSKGYLSYVGGTSVKYIPVDEEVELNLGPARLVSVEPILMDFKTDNYVFDKKKNIAGWDEIRTWKIRITNTRELPIEIEVTRGFGTAYWTLVYVDIASVAADSISYEKHDATHARFTLKRKPSSKWTFGYTVTTYHGMREEAVSE